MPRWPSLGVTVGNSIVVTPYLGAIALLTPGPPMARWLRLLLVL
jgi:hypothetical protein